MRILRVTVISLLSLFVLIQLIPRKKSTSLDTSHGLEQSLYVPNRVGSILRTSCYDCHSNETEYPWYYHVQPVSLLLDRHIARGKDELNFSEFGTYSSRRQRSKLRSILTQVEEGKMPLRSYLLLHWEAKLTVEEKQEIIDWAELASEG